MQAKSFMDFAAQKFATVSKFLVFKSCWNYDPDRIPLIRENQRDRKYQFSVCKQNLLWILLHRNLRLSANFLCSNPVGTTTPTGFEPATLGLEVRCSIQA